MRYQTVHDILSFVRDFHARASRLFEAAADQAQQEKLRWLLAWLADHERRFAAAIQAFERAPENDTLLHEWLQHVPDPEKLPVQLPRIGARFGIDDAVALAIAFDEYLVRVYEAVLASCGSAEVRELFGKLLDQERSEERAVARNLAQLQDL